MGGHDFAASGQGYSYRIKAADSLIIPGRQDASGIIPGNGGELTIDVPVGSETNRFDKLEAWRQ